MCYKLTISFAVVQSLLIIAMASYGQDKEPQNVAGFPVNYDESKVGTYTLPDLFKLKNGDKVANREEWFAKRRPEILSMFEEYQFGKAPDKPKKQVFKVQEQATEAFGGKALRKQITIFLSDDTAQNKINLLMYLPIHLNRPAPLLLNISFLSNSQMVPDTEILKGFTWKKNGSKMWPESTDNVSNIPLNKLLAAGFGYATFYYGDVEPDFKQAIEQVGIRKYYLKPGQKNVASDEWGAIAAWAWGLSRIMDYLATDSQIDNERVALLGVSRLGKAALWAGAVDQRFKMIIASCSGEGGAALSRRDYGENIRHMTDTSRYYYQFAPNRHTFTDDFGKCPIDAHMLLSLLAPRNVLLQTGDQDYWSDPKGEYLAAKAVEPVYNLFDIKNKKSKYPEPGETSLAYQTLGYYMHSGGHGLIPSDWNVFIQYMKKYL